MKLHSKKTYSLCFIKVTSKNTNALLYIEHNFQSNFALFCMFDNFLLNMNLPIWAKLQFLKMCKFIHEAEFNNQVTMYDNCFGYRRGVPSNLLKCSVVS